MEEEVVAKGKAKTLDREKLQNTKADKVNVTFRCAPAVKMAMIQEADKMGVTLSDYVESLVSVRRSEKDAAASLIEANDERDILRKKVKDLEEDLEFYEKGKLADMFEKTKGTTVSVPGKGGARMSVKIATVRDVYKVIINSFQFTSKANV